MSAWPIAKVRGQESFLLNTRSAELAVTALGGMLGPVTFFPGTDTPIMPYAVAPWAEEPVPADTPVVLRCLRGDWFCSAFGANEDVHTGTRLPLHGETANRRWAFEAGQTTSIGSWLRLGVDLPLQGGRCEALTALIAGETVIYQRHDLSGLSGPINPGHHATLSFPDQEGSGRLSFSPHILARTYREPVEDSTSRGQSYLVRDSDIDDLSRARGVDGTTTDLCRYPARRGFEDIALICADPSREYAWSAATFTHDRYVWFAIRNTRHLSSTLLWFSNGGRYYPPWNRRHVNVMGIEDVTGYFAVGLTASCRTNALSTRGVRTCLYPGEGGRICVPYIQGIARIPAEFDRLINMEFRSDALKLIAESGASVVVSCRTDFLRTGSLEKLPFN